ncbi:AsmA family protein [Sphingomonas donggukensis]|uniref:AsmA family protein n=1 Tax=Sphingomonas donggukensis TaxID=2949093 RepID=A0ABY4TUS2_9SPHN|nr:AsmA family protein [Sphingomonas donggukensis]URW75610.1 AsmA family protein [Sphingomonas donggukensis]
MTDTTVPAPAPGPTPAPAEHAPLPIRTPLVAALSVVVSIIGLMVLAWGILYVTKGRFLRGTFESLVGASTHRDVKVGGDFQLYFDPFDLKFVAQKMTISNPGWATKPNLFAADSIHTRVAPLSLIFGRYRMRFLDLQNGAIDLEWNGAKRINTWTFSEEKGEPVQFPIIDRATLAGTTLRYKDPRLRLLADLKFDTVRSAGTRIGDAVRFTGTGTARDTPFTMTGALLSPNETAARGRNQLTLTARAAGNVVTVDGTLPSLADIEDVPLRTTARGSNLASLLGIIGVVLPDTRDYRASANMVKSGDVYSFTGLRGRFGNSDLSGKFAADNSGPRLLMTATLATQALDIVDAAPFIGYNPDIVAAQGVTAAAAATGAAPARLMPDAAFPIASMQRFDAKVGWTIRTVRSKSVPISDVDLTLDLDRGRLALSPLTFAMARGNVASDLIFDTRQRPTAASYDIRLAPTPLSRLLAGWGVDEAGTSGTVKGRIELKGRGDTIHDTLASSRGRIAFILPKGSFWTRNIQLSELDLGTFAQKMFEGRLKEPVQINCGLVGFTVRGGVAAADPILIDTQKNVMLGRGGFSFRNETIDLAFRADSKRFSLFAGQSPVGVNGYFSQPGYDVISPELVGRAGAGLGLALVATPLAGVLAFVDVGDAKATDCGPVLSGAGARAQRTTKGEARDDVGRGTTAKSEDGSRSKGERKEQRKKFLGIF